MTDLILLRNSNGDPVYIVSSSKGIKIENKSKNLTEKLLEIDDTLTELNSYTIYEPDEEDITSISGGNILKLKDRSSSIERKGYKILRKDLPFAEQVIEPNTIYEIRDNFSLGPVENLNLTLETKVNYGPPQNPIFTYIFYSENLGSLDKGIIILDEDVYFFSEIPSVNDTDILNKILSNTYANTASLVYVAKRYLSSDALNINSTQINCKKVNYINIPANCTLKFNGGKISNGIIVGNNTSIEANSSDVIFDNIQTLGIFNCSAYVDWFGAKCSNENSKILGNSSKILNAFRSSFGSFKFNKGYYYIDNTVVISRPISIELEGSPSLPIKTFRKRIIEGQDNFYPIQGTVIWSDLDLDIFLIRIWNKTTPTEKMNINITGGCFDVSESTNFSHAVLHIIPGYGVNLYPYFQTTLLGPNRLVTGNYPEFNLCTGNGIQFTCPGTISGTCYGGYINCEIFRFHTAVKHDDNYIETGGDYITNIEYECYIDLCAIAYDLGLCGDNGGKITGWILASYWFEQEDNDACLITGIRNMYLNPKVWDISIRTPKNVMGTNYYFPKYIFSLNDLTWSLFPKLGAALKKMESSIKGFEFLEKVEGFYNTNSLAENPPYPYLGLFDNALYRYDKLPDYNNIPNLLVTARNCVINTKELLGTRGASISKYRKDAVVTITINNIKHYLTELSLIFINYVKGWDPWEDYLTPSYGIPAFENVIVETYKWLDAIAANPTNGTEAQEAGYVLLNTYDLGPCGKAYQVNQASYKRPLNSLSSSTDRVVITLSGLSGANYKTSYYNADIYDDIGEDDYLDYRTTFYIGVEGKSRDIYRDGISNLTRNGIKINNRNVEFTDDKIIVTDSSGETHTYYSEKFRSGTTRPSSSDVCIGFMFFDTNLGYPIYVSNISGSTITWVNSNGDIV